MPEEQRRQVRPREDKPGATGPVGPVTAGGKQDHASPPDPAADKRQADREAEGPPEPPSLRPESKGAKWAAEVHVPDDVRGLPDREAYIKEQLDSLGLKGGKVVSEEDHPDGGKRLRIEG